MAASLMPRLSILWSFARPHRRTLLHGLLLALVASALVGLINGAVMLVGSLVLMGVLDLVLLATTPSPRRTCRAASGSASRWPARSSPPPTSCSWTRPPRNWTG
ncbi:hypothetical protein ACH4M4_22540 [Streptomyces sp. NPDC017254]|uniref:hypothetical protein n=1 Tax=unclassified Streptomyces TaxID=2593676 RepID=UPI0037A7D5B9